MASDEKLDPGYFYHVYNHAVSKRLLFREEDNYKHFLYLHEKYIEPVAKTFAWALMPNHFHLLVRMKENIGYKYSNADRSIDAVRFEDVKWQTTNLSMCETPDNHKMPNPSKHFSHLFNAYTRYFNKKNEVNGTLFERRFKRKRITNAVHLKNVVLYIHNNPVHHGFCQHPLEYPWTSYLSAISLKQTKLQRNEIIGWFNNKGDFETEHGKELNLKEIEKYLEL